MNAFWCSWFVFMLALLIAFDDAMALDADDLADISWQVNNEYAGTENNCLIVAVEKKRRIGRGKVKCVLLPEKYLPVKRHCYLVVDGWILDNGGLRGLIL